MSSENVLRSIACFQQCERPHVHWLQRGIAACHCSLSGNQHNVPETIVVEAPHGGKVLDKHFTSPRVQGLHEIVDCLFCSPVDLFLLHDCCFLFCRLRLFLLFTIATATKTEGAAEQMRKPRRVSGCEWQRGTSQTAFASRFGAIPAQARSNRPSPGTGAHPTKAEGEKQATRSGTWL